MEYDLAIFDDEAILFGVYDSLKLSVHNGRNTYNMKIIICVMFRLSFNIELELEFLGAPTGKSTQKFGALITKYKDESDSRCLEPYD